MPRALLEACDAGHGDGCKYSFQDMPSRLAGSPYASQRTSHRNTASFTEDVYKPIVFRGRALRSSYGEFLQGPDVPSDFMPKASPNIDAELKLPPQPDDNGSVVVLEQVTPDSNTDDGGRVVAIPPAAAQALAEQLVAAELKDAMQATHAVDIQPHGAPGTEELDIGEDPSMAAPGGPGHSRGEEDVEYWVMEDGGDGKGPVMVQHEHSHTDTGHHTHHSHEHVGHLPRRAMSNHHIAVQQHLTAKAVHKHAESTAKTPEHPTKSHEQPKTQQELDQEAEQLLQEPRVADWQPKIVLGGALAIFAQFYLWGTVFVTLFKPTRQNGVPQTAEVTQTSAPASAGPQAPIPSSPIVLSGAGGLLRGQAAQPTPMPNPPPATGSVS